MGRLAIGNNAFGNSSGFEVKGFNDTPGPHNIMACSPSEGTVEWGILMPVIPKLYSSNLDILRYSFSDCDGRSCAYL